MYLETFEETWDGARRWTIGHRFFRLLSAPLAVDIRFGPGQSLTNTFKSMDAGVAYRIAEHEKEVGILQITNPSSQAVKFILGDSESSYDRAFGTVSISGNVAVTMAGGVIASGSIADSGIVYGTSFQSSTLLGANSPENVIAAASNTGGFVVWAATMRNAISTGVTRSSMLAKATAPATPIDGDVLLLPTGLDITASQFHSAGDLQRAVRVALGKRLDFISTTAEDNGPSGRRALYTLL